MKIGNILIFYIFFIGHPFKSFVLMNYYCISFWIWCCYRPFGASFLIKHNFLFHTLEDGGFGLTSSHFFACPHGVIVALNK